MKTLVSFFLAALLLCNSALGMTIRTPHGVATPKRIIEIVGIIDEAMTASVTIQLRNSRNISGPITVDIYSPGGSVSEGRKIIKMLEQERNRLHTKLIGVAEHGVHSMGFAILTHCDVRVATSDTTMVVHKVALGGDPGVRMSAKNLRKIADEMDREDGPMAEENRKAMHLSADDYDKYADQERRWTAKELLALHYLDAIVVVTE